MTAEEMLAVMSMEPVEEESEEELVVIPEEAEEEELYISEEDAESMMGEGTTLIEGEAATEPAE